MSVYKLGLVMVLAATVLGGAVSADSDVWSDNAELIKDATIKMRGMFADQQSAIDGYEKAALAGEYQGYVESEREKISTIENTYKGTGFNFNQSMVDSSQVPGLMSMAEEAGNRVKGGMGADGGGIDKPVVLVSFSMPKPALKSLMEQLDVVGGSIIFTGLVDDDFTKTFQAIRALDAKKGSALIDPTLFERFKVQQVPTFIVPIEPIKACESNTQCDVPRHIKAAGDVSLDYVLDLVKRSGNDEEKAIADRYLRMIRG